MISPSHARRRWFGALFLVLAGGMLVWGQTVLRAQLKGWGFITYWLGCFLLTCFAFIIAWLDLREVRRQIRAQQRSLLEDALREVQRSPTSRPKPTPPEKS